SISMRNTLNAVTARVVSSFVLTMLALFAFLGMPAMALQPLGDLPNQNTYDGANSLSSLTSGANNAGLGYNALHVLTTGNSNTAVGALTLQSATGGNNIALGANAGVSITSGSFNIDIGNQGVSGDIATIRIGDSNQNAAYLGGVLTHATSNGNSWVVGIENNGQLGIVETSSLRGSHGPSCDAGPPI